MAIVRDSGRNIFLWAADESTWIQQVQGKLLKTVCSSYLQLIWIFQLIQADFTFPKSAKVIRGLGQNGLHLKDMHALHGSQGCKTIFRFYCSTIDKHILEISISKHKQYSGVHWPG